MGLLSTITSTAKNIGSVITSLAPGGQTPRQAVTNIIKSSPVNQAVASLISRASPAKAAIISSPVPVSIGTSRPTGITSLPKSYSTPSVASIGSAKAIEIPSGTPTSTPSVTNVATGLGVGALAAAALNKKEKAEIPVETKMADDNIGSSLMVAGRSLSTLASKGSFLSKLGTAGLIAGGLYAGEQLAETLGVRGGAGFIGARPSKRRKRMNVANVKALKRADRRIDGFMKVYKKIASQAGFTTERRKAPCSSKRK